MRTQITQCGDTQLFRLNYLNGPNNENRNDPEFEKIYNEKLDYLRSNVGMEMSNVGTSHGVTQEVEKEFASLLAGIGIADAIRLMNCACWSGEGETAVHLIYQLLDKAMKNIAEDQALSELNC